MARSTRSALSSNSVPATGLHLVVDAGAVELLDLARPRRRSFCVITAKSRSAPSSWLDEVRSFIGQSGQVSALFSFSRRLRHDLELGDRQRALADRGADAVRAGVAAADDDDVLAAGEDRQDVAERLVADAAVLLGQEIHGEMDAVELAAGDRQVARLLGAAGERDRVVAVEQLGRSASSMPTWTLQWKMTPSASICGDAPVDVALLHLEVGNAVAQQAAGVGVLLVDVDVMAGAARAAGRRRGPPGPSRPRRRACRSSVAAARA